MAPRANWKGFLRLSLVTCPVALYPATSDTEKVSFNQINRKTGHRIKYSKVDADTGEEVANEDIVKGYKVDTDTYIEVSKEELDDIALESTHTIEIDEFVDARGTAPRIPAEQTRRHRDVFADGHVREEADALEDVADPAPQHGRIGEAHVFVLDEDAARVGLGEAVDQAQ